MDAGARGGRGGGSVSSFRSPASALMKALFTSRTLSGLLRCSWLLLFLFGNGGGVSLFPFGDFGRFSSLGGGERGKGGGVWFWVLDGVDGDCSCKREKQKWAVLVFSVCVFMCQGA